MPFIEIKDDVIQSRKLEYNLVEHCNLSCSECSHMSPYMAKNSLSLDVFISDINKLAKVYHVEKIRFVGGEPLLNKDILKYIRAARESNIANYIEIVTNGILLDRMSDDFFASVDSIDVSSYPAAQSNDQVLEFASNKCRQYGTKFDVEKISTFRTMEVRGPIEEKKIVSDIYQSCLIAHTWYCQTFYNGKFYLCSRPIFTGSYYHKAGISTPDFQDLDGISLDEPELLNRLIEVLKSPHPLKACEYCLGTVGQHKPWKQLESRKSPPVIPIFNHKSISWNRMKFLLICRNIESAIINVFPSSMLAKWFSVVITGVIGD